VVVLAAGAVVSAAGAGVCAGVEVSFAVGALSDFSAVAVVAGSGAGLGGSCDQVAVVTSSVTAASMRVVLATHTPFKHPAIDFILRTSRS
jgi:hypothetical protein